jgi:hypothetical protein
MAGVSSAFNAALDGGGDVGFIFDDEDFGHGRFGMSAGIKVVYHTQKVSYWHNKLAGGAVPESFWLRLLSDLAVSKFGKCITRSGIKR